MTGSEKLMNVDEIALSVFLVYFKRQPGEGAFTLEHDMKQLDYIRELVEAWYEVHDEFVALPHDEAMTAARNQSYSFDRTYTNEVLDHYNAKMREEHTND